MSQLPGLPGRIGIGLRCRFLIPGMSERDIRIYALASRV
jgi:hypothetical protein